MKTAEIIAQIAHVFEQRAARNLIVGVSGIDGSGKSKLASKLESGLNSGGIMARQISIDDFLQPKSLRHKNPNQIQGYFEDNFNYDSLNTQVLVPVRNSMSVDNKIPVLDLDTDQISEQPFRFSGPGVLIVEGVFLFRKELRDAIDFKIWIQIDFKPAMARILNRVRDKRYGDAAAIRSRYETRFFPTQRFHLERDKPCEFADIVLELP